MSLANTIALSHPLHPVTAVHIPNEVMLDSIPALGASHCHRERTTNNLANCPSRQVAMNLTLVLARPRSENNQRRAQTLS